MSSHFRNETSQVPVTALTQPWHDVVFAGQGSALKVFDCSSTEVIYSDTIFADQAIHGLAHQSIESDTLLLLAWGGRSVFFCHVSREQSNKSRIGYNLYVDHKSVIKVSDWIFDVTFRPVDGRSLPASWEAVAVTAHDEIIEMRSQRDYTNHDERSSTIVSTKIFSGPKCGLYSATLQWLTCDCLLVISGTAFGEIVVWSLDLKNDTVEALRHHIFTGHEGSIFGVSVSDEIPAVDGTNMRLLASCSDDRTIRVWNISDLQHGTVLNQESTTSDGKESSRTTGFLNYVSEEAAAESSKLCIARGMGHLSRIWDIRFAIERSPQTNDEYICSVISVGEDATCQTWHMEQKSKADVQTCKLVHVASNNLHDGTNIWSLSTIYDSQQSCIVTGGADGKIVEHSSLQQHAKSQDNHIVVSEWTIGDTLEQVLLADAEDERSRSLGGHVTANFCSKKGKKGKQDSFRSFSAIGTSQFLITTNEGLVLLATNIASEGWTWKRLAQFDDLRGYSVACHLVAEPCEYVFFGDARGTIYYYHSLFETIKVLTKIDGKITKLMAEILASSPHEYMSIVVTRQGGQPPVQLRINLGFGGSITLASTKTFSKWSPDFPQITSAVVATHESVEKGLIIGCRNGTIYSYSNVESSDKGEFDFELPLSHGKEAVTAMSWLPHRGHRDNMWKSAFGWLFSVGRDGTLAIHKWEGNHTDPVIVHRLSLSFGPNLEGVSIDPNTLDVSVWGFTSKFFVLQNVSALEDVVSVECGGAHRVWDFAPFAGSPDGMNRGLFTWIKAMKLNLASLNRPSHKVLQSGSHGREIKTCAVAPAIIHRGLGPLVATGAEDTDIAIHYLADWHAGQAQMKRLVVLRKHVTGVQSLQWSSDGNFLFSCGGFEEFFVWRLRPVPGISIGVVCESKLPHETLDSELRITDFSVCDVAIRERSSLGDEHWLFLISIVYSDSSIKIWNYTSSDSMVPDRQAWSLVASTQYTTACLTSVACLSSNPTGLPLVTGSTDGYLAFWSLSVMKRKLTCENLQVLHQNSIKSLAKMGLTDISWLVASGGDDNALGLTLLTYDDEAGVYESASLLIPSAHAAAINAVTILRTHASEIGRVPIELDVVTAGNDQTIRIWKISIDPRKRGVNGLDVSRSAKIVSAVADISSLACFPRRHGSSGRFNKLLVSGVGTEVWAMPSIIHH